MQMVPGGETSVTRACASTSPRLDVTRTRSPLAMASATASRGWISTNSSGRSVSSPGTRRVIVAV